MFLRPLPAVLLALAVLAPAPAPALAARPGPALLYAKPAKAPQLANAGIWHAPPILVSGTTAYRRGEFLYQDFLYDDHGAQATADPGDPRTAGNLFSKPNGTYTYPTDPGYAGNAADIVELRARPLKRATAFRLTLNTLKDPSLIAFTLALASRTSPSRPLPFGANVSAPADVVLTVHPGAGGALVGELTDAVSGGPIAGPAARVAVNRRRRQIDVRVPHTAWAPQRRRMRVAAGVGLWDAAAGRYLLPQAAADATHPGGGGSGRAGRVLQRRLPHPRGPAVGLRRDRRRDLAGLVARQAPGGGARPRRHLALRHRHRLPAACPAGDRQPPRARARARWTGSSPAASRPGRAPTSARPASPTRPTAPGRTPGGCSPTRSTSPGSRARARATG